MMTRFNIFIWAVMVIMPIFLFCKTKSTYGSGAITLLDKPVPNNEKEDSCYGAYCERMIRYFDFDTTCYLDQKYSNTPYILEECFPCSLLKLTIHHSTIDLDSVYRVHLKSEDARYMAGFVEGKYIIENEIIRMNLTFINLCANTSRSTAHEYSIVHDTKQKKFISADMRFLEQ